MFRPPQTRILLSDYEVLQTIHSIWTLRFMTPNLPYRPPVSEEDEDEDEAEFYQDSLSTSYPRSSSAGYTMSDHDRYACDLLKRYRDSKTYFNSSASDLDDLPEYSAGPHTTLATRSTNRTGSYQSEGVYQNVMEIPDSQISSTPQESFTDTSPPATIILSPRSPEPTPRARRGSRMDRPGYYGNFPVLQVQVPDIYGRMWDMVLSDIMSGSARFNELAWQIEPPAQLLRDTYSRLPLRLDQQTNWNRYMLAPPPNEKSSTAIVKAQPAKWPKENMRSRTHRRPAKKSLLLEVIGQDDEVDEEQRSSE